MKRRGRRITLLIAGILCAVLPVLLFTACRSNPPEDHAKVIFAGTQDDADCAALLSQDACLLIDTGEEQDAEHILELLRREEVTTVDYMILTHPDKDHIGGASAILDELDVKKILVPHYTKDDDRYDQLLKKIREKGVPLETVSKKEAIQCGELMVEVYPPEKSEYSKDNNYSLATLVQHGEVNLFFAGDAQKKRMEEILRYHLPKIALYKVSHHGRDQNAGALLIRRMQPQYAVVTAYGPEGEIANALEEVGAQVICTRQNDAVFVSDGLEINKRDA